MLIVALLGALLFYGALYLIWASTETRLDTVPAWLDAIHAMAFMPGNLIFTILRGMILIVTLYVICDFLRSAAKRVSRKRLERRRDKEEPFAVTLKEPGFESKSF